LFRIIGSEATVSVPEVEIKPSSLSALVGDTVEMRCLAHLQQDSPVHMHWSLPTKVHYSTTLVLDIHW